MIIHTLGPETTDSSEAARYYLHRQAGQGRIVLHERFEAIIERLPTYGGDMLLIPAAYKSADGSDWADFHYTQLNRLKLVDCFHRPLQPLVLIRRKIAAHETAYTHPATAVLLKNYLHAVGSRASLCFAGSKDLAYRRYCEQQGRYVLTGMNSVRHGADDGTIEATYTADMVWCVYQILREAKVNFL
ncbi:MAG: hypothetical protein LKI94_01275 [Sporolactobacillus sp.]|nr:hypothetical protein [Sporolactobacillus sp.]MCI1880807.1 hypothetical protein [Sporolactobacillus sp.]